MGSHDVTERYDNPHVVRNDSAFLKTELIFTIVGGYLDAYSYVAHGKVFANAQTGNVVLLAVYTASKDWSQALRRIPPILAWIVGIVGAMLVGVRPGKQAYSASLFCKTFEVFVLFLLAAYGSVIPDPWVVPILSFLAAFQLASFVTPGKVSFNSTVITGNLRSGVVALVLALKGQDAATNGRIALVEGIACMTFLIGALLGGAVTLRHSEHALLPAAVIGVIGLYVGWRSLRQVRSRG